MSRWIFTAQLTPGSVGSYVCVSAERERNCSVCGCVHVSSSCLPS